MPLLLAIAPGTLSVGLPGFPPAPPFGADANGGWFDREVHTEPAANGTKPNVVMVLLDDWYAYAVGILLAPHHAIQQSLPRNELKMVRFDCTNMVSHQGLG